MPGWGLSGHTETSSKDFDSWIVDEYGLVSAQRGEEFFINEGAEDVTADTVRWTPRNDSPWYLIIDLPRRSKAREVTVDLRWS